jgi:5-methylcytosine-specific restriction protein A
MPSVGFFEAYRRKRDDFNFWIDQMAAAKCFDWSSVLNQVGSLHRVQANHIEITWSAGVVEKIALGDLSSDGNWVTTVEEWDTASLPKAVVQYRAFGALIQSGTGESYELKYEREKQVDKNVRQYSRSGTTEINFDVEGKAFAVWSDDVDESFNGPALSVRILGADEVVRQAPEESIIKNSLSLTAYLASLGCRLRIGWYWSAASEDKKRVIFTIWDDQIENNEYLLLPSAEVDWKYLPGAYELRRHFPLARSPGAEVYGVLCHAVDGSATRRERQYFNEHELVRLHIREVNGDWVALLGDVVPASYVRNGVQAPPTIGDALNDVEVPLGAENPEAAPTERGSRIIRDAMVREYVLLRANGKCEYCGKEGFLMPNNKRYLECHHVDALASGGPDTVHNVIALCANDHREAHYGINRTEIGIEMLKVIKAHNLPRNRVAEH